MWMLLVSWCSLVFTAAPYLLLLLRNSNNVGVVSGAPNRAIGLLASDETDDDSRIEPKQEVVLPNLLLVGTQKSGSTVLANWIFDHDDVCGAGLSPPYTKEVHFFDIQERYRKGLDAYSSLFSHCEKSSVVLDATPGYFLVADRARKVYDAAGGMQAMNLKVIVTLRDPVARELSIYNHKSYNARMRGDGWWHSVIKDDGSIMIFSEYVDNVTLHEIASKRSASLYAYNLQEWMKAFDRSQILVLSYDELKQDTDSLLARVRKFVGLEEKSKIRSFSR